MMDQQIKESGQMRTPPPLTPSVVESRVLRICNEYDKIQEAQKHKVNINPNQMSCSIEFEFIYSYEKRIFNFSF